MKDQFEIETVCLYREPCNCDDGHIRHNNGGNYHQNTNLITVTNGERFAVILENTSTREDFPGDKLESLCVDDQGFYLCQKDCQSADDIELRAFRQGDADILTQS